VEVRDTVGKFETLFEEALKSDGNRYRQIRSEVTALKSSDVTALEGKLRHPDWRVRLQAEIFRGWRTDPERYEYIRRVAHGTEPTLEPEIYITGKPHVETSSKVLADLGSGYLPALLEIIYKELDVLTDYAFDVCAKAINSWQDSRAIPVYRNILMNQTVPPAYRRSSVHWLFELNANSLFEGLTSIYEDERNPLELRVTTIASIGSLEDERAIPFLESILTKTIIQNDFRRAAAVGLGKSQNPNVIDLLAQQYASADNDDLKESIIMALGTIEDPRAIEPLKKIRSMESDPGLLEIIDETLEGLEYLE
jgi:HEAT repeat protein